MALDRNFVERRDFSAARRGYDPDEVDRHLAEVAAAMEELSEELREARDVTPQPLSGAAAERVQIILEAAERSAAELETRARESAERATREADDLAREVGARAEAEIESRANRVEQASEQMLRRTEEIEGELSTMRENLQAADSVLSGLEAQTGPLRAEVDALRGGLTELRERVRAHGGDTSEMMAAATGPGVESGVDEPDHADRRALDQMDASTASAAEPSPWSGAPDPRGAEEEISPEATDEDEEDPTLEEEDLLGEDEEAAALEEDAVVLEEEDATSGGLESDLDEEPTGRRGRGHGGSRGSGRSTRSSGGESSDEGARLVALNMALNGTPREETERYLEENFELRDPDSLLDEVYSRVGG